MAEKLDCLTRRRLLNTRDLPPDRCREMARDFTAEGFPSDAVDFLLKAGDRAGLDELKAAAIKEGDFFIFNRIKKALGLAPSAVELENLAANALDLGKEVFATQARRLLHPEAEPAPGAEEQIHEG